MGHITVMDDSEAQFALTHYSQDLWKELAPSLPADAEYGFLWVDLGGRGRFGDGGGGAEVRCLPGSWSARGDSGCG